MRMLAWKLVSCEVCLKTYLREISGFRETSGSSAEVVVDH